nr:MULTISPECIES: biotin--[acetyl-CoA-carboxylase] ligase [unclassified Leptolyngbya]
MGSISPQPIPSFQIHIYETVTSTNVILWDLLEQGAPEGTVAIAHQQDSGRGQRGRFWHSHPGGLYLSLGLFPDRDPSDATGLTLCCAWGIAAALQGWQIPVGLKWINDVVLDGLKLGGILTETRIQQGRMHRAVIGVGLNWANPVPETGIALEPWLVEQGKQGIDSLEMLAAIALQGAMGGYCFWKSVGTSGFISHYERLLVNRGQSIMYEGQAATVLGIAAGGQLRIRLEHSGAETHLEPGQIQLGYPTPRFGSCIE